MRQGPWLTPVEAQRSVSWGEGHPCDIMESSAELRAKRASFLARFDIGEFKISKQELNVPELRYHHNQKKDNFRLDRIEQVRHLVQEPVEQICEDSHADDRLFLIASKIYPKVAHRAQLSSQELLEAAKKGNLTRPAPIPTGASSSCVGVGTSATMDFNHSEQVSTASANMSIVSVRSTHSTVRSSTKSSMPCKKRRNLERAKLHAEKNTLSKIRDDIPENEDDQFVDTERKVSPRRAVCPFTRDPLHLEKQEIFALQDIGDMIQDMPTQTREEMLESIRKTIVHFMAPIPARVHEPLEEPEPHDQVIGTGERVPQPYSTIGGAREDLRPTVFVLSILTTQIEGTTFETTVETPHPQLYPSQ